MTFISETHSISYFQKAIKPNCQELKFYLYSVPKFERQVYDSRSLIIHFRKSSICATRRNMPILCYLEYRDVIYYNNLAKRRQCIYL